MKSNFSTYLFDVLMITIISLCIYSLLIAIGFLPYSIYTIVAILIGNFTVEGLRHFFLEEK